MNKIFKLINFFGRGSRTFSKVSLTNYQINKISISSWKSFFCNFEDIEVSI